MSRYFPRPPAGTLQEQIFRLLRDVGSMSAGVAAELLDYDRECLRARMQDLHAAGYLTHHKIRARCVIYSAARRRPPSDRRGKQKGCRNHRGQVAYAKWLVMMTKKCKPGWRPPTGDQSALAQAWAMPHPISQPTEEHHA